MSEQDNKTADFKARTVGDEFGASANERKASKTPSGAEFDPYNIGQNEVEPSKGLWFHCHCQ